MGIDLLRLLKNVDLDVLKNKASKAYFLTDDMKREMSKNLGLDYDSEMYQDWSKYFEKYPHLSRDHSYRIISTLINSPDGLGVQNNISFANESLFCEWAYVIDLDTNKLEVYKGFNTTPLEEGDRFYSEFVEDGEYYGVRKVAEFYLRKLPSEKRFLLSCDDEDINP